MIPDKGDNGYVNHLGETKLVIHISIISRYSHYLKTKHTLSIPINTTL